MSTDTDGIKAETEKEELFFWIIEILTIFNGMKFDSIVSKNEPKTLTGEYT